MGRRSKIPPKTWENVKILYDQGLNDSAIGRQVGLHSQSVRYWRKQHNLEPQFKARWHKDEKTRFIQIFSPQQCDEMRRFLSLCIAGAKIAHQNGSKMELGRLLRKWHGRGRDYFEC